MALEDVTPRIALIIFIGLAVTVLFIMSGTDLWGHKYREGILFLILGGGLAFVFFRKRMLALALVGLTFVLVTAGLTSAFHPTIAGILLTTVSSAGLFLIIRWHSRKFPNLGPKDWQTVFNNRTDVTVRRSHDG